jgi:hypothetical protein
LNLVFGTNFCIRNIFGVLQKDVKIGKKIAFNENIGVEKNSPMNYSLNIFLCLHEVVRC